MNQKTIIGVIIAIVLVAVIAMVYFISFNGTKEKDNNVLDNQTPNKINSASKSLVVYFSVPETDDPNHMTRDENN